MRSALVAALVIASAALASLAGGAPAGAQDNNRGDASEAMYSAVRTVFGSSATKSGRRIETACYGNGPNYPCDWWIIKGRLDRKVAVSPLEVLKRSGEGNAHSNPRNVLRNGQGMASWVCKRTAKGKRCAQWGFRAVVY